MRFKPDGIPFSFKLGDTKVTGIPESWNPIAAEKRLDDDRLVTVYEAKDPDSGLALRIEWTEYVNESVAEWLVWLTNEGGEPTPVIQDLLALDYTFAGRSPVVHHNNGDFYSEEGYTPEETPLAGEGPLYFAPKGGRPCDRAFPYFRVECAGEGVTLAVGWPAQWHARFEAREGGFHVAAGQQRTHFRLFPGERVRTPRITVMTWTGTAKDAINLWRRWYLKYILPRPDGKPLGPMLQCAATDDGPEFTEATEENQLRYMDRAKGFGLDFDVWWIDAGWYPCEDENGEKKWPKTGTWEPDPKRFPAGFKSISEKAKSYGAKLLIWFEPERVTAGSRIDVEHPEWLLRLPGEAEKSPNRLLNLGDPECREWLTDHVCRLIAENGIGIYRQDFNFEPLPFWVANEAWDRQGFLENQHVQGYLQYWDDLLKRNPGLWIDSCASGGRRNDLETLRRSVPLHYTDYGYGYHHVKVAFHHTLHSWFPYFREGTNSWDTLPDGTRPRAPERVDPFAYHCGLGPMLSPKLDVRRDDYDYALARRLIAIWREAAPHLLYGDYYRLTPYSKSLKEWVALQFHSPRENAGYIQGIRHAECPEERLTVFPEAVSPGLRYSFRNPETGVSVEVTGEHLIAEGFTFALPPRSGAIWFYSARRGEA